MAKVYFFGYGANRSGDRLREIFGHEVTKVSGAILDNNVLSYQVLDQVPEKPREILQRVWGNEFRCYTARTGEGQIVGVVWELEESDLEILKEWEFIGEWRDLVPVKVKTTDGKEIQALTDKVSDTAPIKEVVDGLFYEDNLNKEGRNLDAIEKEYKIAEMKKIREELTELSRAQGSKI